MASQQDYTHVANALLAFALAKITFVPGWERNFIPMDKLPAAAGAAAKVAVDTLDAYRARPISAVQHKRRRRKNG